MNIKEENINRLIDVMFNLIMSMKHNTTVCCDMMGGLNEKELTVVTYVGKNGDVKMTDIAESMDVPLSTLTSIVDKLVLRKYLDRYHSENDRRVVMVCMGNTGTKQFKIFMEQKREIAKAILSEYSSKDQLLLIDNLNTLVRIIKSK